MTDADGRLDVVIRGGTVYDGTGAPGTRADVGVRGDRIAAVGAVAARGVEELDASGLAVAPGFIDVHTHDVATYASPRQPPAGIRTVYVNGVAVARDGVHTGARPGRALCRGRA